MDFVTLLYKATNEYPQSEMFGLVSQMRRAAVSITSNIAEGYGRSTNTDLVHFLYMSLGSSNELDTQIAISHNLGFLDDERFCILDTKNDEINKMLKSLIYKRTHSQTSDNNLNPSKP